MILHCNVDSSRVLKVRKRKQSERVEYSWVKRERRRKIRRIVRVRERVTERISSSKKWNWRREKITQTICFRSLRVVPVILLAVIVINSLTIFMFADTHRFLFRFRFLNCDCNCFFTYLFQLLIELPYS